METSSDPAVTGNLRLFEQFAKTFRVGTPEGFLEACNKLTIFLKDGRAYYDQGREHIVALVEVCQDSHCLREFF